jgi:DNA-binding LacI/PurR family transcriptional regulator
MPENALVRCGQGQSDGYNYVKKLLDAGKMPDALYVGHDVLANGVLLALYEKGLRAPRDLGLLAHQNKGAEIFAPLRLSVVQVDPAQIVRNAFDFIMGFDGRLPEGENLTRTRIQGTYVPGETMRS